jgi:hypothetical protein
LNDATRLQIEAEDLLKHECDAAAPGDTMTIAEMTYLEAMEEVKTISKKLVTAERAFALVRDRMQELVNRYQSLLVKIETESSFGGASSIMTYESSCYSENDSEYWEQQEEQDNLEKQRWARRARRAEIRAELAAREALMAKQEVRQIQEEKERELEELQQKLMELQSDPSTVLSGGEKERSLAIAKNYAMHRNDAPGEENSAVRSKNGREGINKEKLDGVKQRFRDRIAAKKREANGMTSPSTYFSPQGKAAAPVTPSPPSARSLFRSAGEEMYQHLDFYERSLKAVESTRAAF